MIEVKILITVLYAENENPLRIEQNSKLPIEVDVDTETIRENIVDIFSENWADWEKDGVLSPQWSFEELYEESYLYEDDEDNFLDVSNFVRDVVTESLLDKFDEIEKIQFAILNCSFEIDGQKYQINFDDQYMEEWFSDYSAFKIIDGEIEFIEEYEPNSY